MALASLLCAVAGHRWTPSADADDPNATFHCERCGRVQSFTGTRGIDKSALKGDFDKSAGPFGGPRG
jgi:hypothetical protein